MKSFFAEGPNGSVYFDGEMITVTRTGMWSVLTGMKGKVQVPIDKVGSIRFIPARLTQGQGFIQFIRSDDPMAELRHRSYGRKDEYANAKLDQLSCSFSRKQQPAFEELRDAVNRAIGVVEDVPVYAELPRSVDVHSPVDFSGQQPGPDIAEQIRKLAALRDDGILTEEEFLAKKTELLDRI